MWAQKCSVIVAGKIASWSATQALVEPTPPDSAFYENLYDKWVDYETTSATVTGTGGKPLKFRYRPWTKWVSFENKCYVGDASKFIMPNCMLYKNKVKTEGVRTLDTKYDFAFNAQADIMSTLSRKGLLGGTVGGGEDQSNTGDAPGGKAPLGIVD